MRRWFTTILVALMLLGACTQPAEPLRVGTLLWPPYDLAHLAMAEGYVRPDQVVLIDYQTPAEVVRAYRHGLIDAHFLTSQFALADHPGRDDTRIVYVINVSHGGDSLLARPDIASLDQLEDRRIGVEAGPLGVYMLQRVLDRAGLSRDQIEPHFVDTPGHVAAFTSGAVDAVITYEPFRARVLAAGGVELFSSRDIPGEIIDLLFAAGEVVDSRQAALVELVRGIEQARRLLEDRPEHALAIMSERHGMNSDQFAQALEGARLLDLEQNRKLLSGDPPELLDHIERQSDIFRRAGLLASDTPVTAAPTSVIVEGALR